MKSPNILYNLAPKNVTLKQKNAIIKEANIWDILKSNYKKKKYNMIYIQYNFINFKYYNPNKFNNFSIKAFKI